MGNPTIVGREDVDVARGLSPREKP
jgi:hypothetical protein